MSTGPKVFTGLLAIGALVFSCGVEAVDYANKTCPCPAELACDTSLNRCVAIGTQSRASASGGDACVPRSCEALAVECGPTDDGCGGLLDCGRCASSNMACSADTHRCVCQPKNCEAQGAECGEVPSGCGETFKCAACPSATPTCGGGGSNKCGTGACTPRTCEGRCGTISDRCGGILECGGCTAPATCGGAKDPDMCGCTPKTCAQVGWQCGSGPDGCGGTRTCSSCSSGVCSASHVCEGCVKRTCQTAGWDCGSGSDGCGGTLTCAACPTGKECKPDHRCEDDN